MKRLAIGFLLGLIILCSTILLLQPQTTRVVTTVTPALTKTLVPTDSSLPISTTPPKKTIYKSIEQRIGDRVFPSIFQAWNGADNLPGEDPDVTVARHDLAWYSEGQLEIQWDNAFAGLGTSFITSSLVGAGAKRNIFLGYNPNMILLAEVRYHDGPPNWLPFDHTWWVRDANGDRTVGWPEGGYYVLDWRKPAFRTQVAAQAKAFIETGIFDGIFLDWWQDGDPDRLEMLKEVRSAIGEDKLIIVNSNRSPTPNSAPYVNGLFMEANAPIYAPEWAEIGDTLLWAETNLRHPRVNALETFYVSSRDDLNRMRATTALALTHSNGYVLFSDPNSLPEPDHLHNWYAFWDQKTLGKPIGAMIKRSDGAFQREFDGGTVIYNPLYQAIRVAFTETRTSAATGESATTFSLNAMDGDLYIMSPSATR